MSARADATIWLDNELPTVRAQALAAAAGGDTPRAFVGIADVLTIIGPVDTLRATLVAALAQLDALEAGR